MPGTSIFRVIAQAAAKLAPPTRAVDSDRVNAANPRKKTRHANRAKTLLVRSVLFVLVGRLREWIMSPGFPHRLFIKP